MIWVYRCLDLSAKGDLRQVHPGRKSLTSVRDGQERRGLPRPKGEKGMSTFIASEKEAIANSRWHIIDAEGQVLGRIATVAARLLQGKHKATYTPFIDTGDHVVVVNAAKVKLTGRKEDQKIYRQHSGYEGGLREERARLVRAR